MNYKMYGYHVSCLLLPNMSKYLQACCDQSEWPLNIPLHMSRFPDMHCTCRFSGTYTAQPVEESDAGVLVSTAEDQGLDALATFQEPHVGSSKSKMQVGH